MCLLTPEWLMVFATLLLAIVAIFGEQIRRYLFRPSLRIESIKPRSLSSPGETVKWIHYVRVTNKGCSIAKSVRARLSEFYCEEDKNKEAEVAPFYLRWYLSDIEKDISCEEDVWLEVIELKEGKYKFCTPDEHKIDQYDNLSESKEYRFTIDFFEKNRKLKGVTLRGNPASSDPLQIVPN